jgi:death-on-curing protein
MKHVTLRHIFRLHQLILEQASGRAGVRDLGGLESAVAQPRLTFDGADLYPTVREKAAALGFSLIRNHPFTDGNKRVGHAAMELLLALNGLTLEADIDTAERVILGVAAGALGREELLGFLQDAARPQGPPTPGR